MSASLGHDAESTYEHVLFPRNQIHEDAGRLAHFLQHLRYESIPANVIHMAKLVTLDTLGCIVAGAQTELGKKILASYCGGSQPGGCCVPGTSLTLEPSISAKVSGWLSDVLDYEDVAAGHPSASVVPAVLAVAERFQRSPQQFLAGVVGGYEAGLRVYDATLATPQVYLRFASYVAWHGVAAGAGAMVVAGGTEEQFRSALGHAAANTCLPLWYLEYGRPAHALKSNYGQMAQGGVDAALCARQGIIGPFAMLSDPERGFSRMIGSDQFDPSKLSAGLNEIWRTSQTSLKAFPCCAYLHTTVDAVGSLVRAHRLDPTLVEGIKIRCFSRIPKLFSDKQPATAIDAQFSVEYVSAMALLGYEPGREWYAPSVMASAEVARLMNIIEIEIDEEADKAFWSGQFISSTTITMNSGQSFSTRVDWPPGHWRRPFSTSDVEAKFLANLKDTQLEDLGGELIERVMKMEEFDSLTDLCRLLTPK